MICIPRLTQDQVLAAVEHAPARIQRVELQGFGSTAFSTTHPFLRRSQLGLVTHAGAASHVEMCTLALRDVSKDWVVALLKQPGDKGCMHPIKWLFPLDNIYFELTDYEVHLVSTSLFADGKAASSLASKPKVVAFLRTLVAQGIAIKDMPMGILELALASLPVNDKIAAASASASPPKAG
jgi:hypothetical protein